MRVIRNDKSKVRSLGRWLVVGLGIKRWLFLLMVGAITLGIGVVHLASSLRATVGLPPPLEGWLTLDAGRDWIRIALLVLSGGLIIYVSISKLILSMVAPYRRPGEFVVDRLYEHNRRRKGPHIVAIGGGTGLSTLLRGLTLHTNSITAVVTVADDGGSSGRIREELGLLPPGDIRNNMAALATDEALMSQLLQYRFAGIDLEGEGSLHGHSFGNLLLAALAGITGSFDEGLLAAERVLALRGRVLPATLEHVRLVADVRSADDGRLERVVGESAIPQAGRQIERLHLDPPGVRAFPPAVQAILQADLVVLGPGSLYTSIIPNLLVEDLASALQRTRAPVVYVCNLVIQPGETDNYTVGQHMEALDFHLPTGCIDLVLANDNFQPAESAGLSDAYVQLVPVDEERLILADLVNEAEPSKHDSQKLANHLMKLIL